MLYRQDNNHLHNNYLTCYLYRQQLNVANSQIILVYILPTFYLPTRLWPWTESDAVQ